MSGSVHLRDARLVRWRPAEFIDRVREAMAIYAEAMGYSTSVIETRAGHATAHAGRPGFRAVAALGSEDSLVGFGYGYTSEPGQWWHDQVAKAIDRTDAGWLSGSLELCELHVRPSWQGAGIGRAILTMLLADAPQPAVLLSTPEGDTRAWRLYRSVGFVDLARHHLFPGDGRPFAVLGVRLPLLTASAPDIPRPATPADDA